MKQVATQLLGITKWLEDSVKANPGALNICFNKFALIELLEDIKPTIEEARAIIADQGVR